MWSFPKKFWSKKMTTFPTGTLPGTYTSAGTGYANVWDTSVTSDATYTIYKKMAEMAMQQAVMPTQQPVTLDHMLKARFGLHSSQALPFTKVICEKVNDTLVVVLVINEGKHAILEDEAALFPSDKLMTQLRMLKG